MHSYTCKIKLKIKLSSVFFFSHLGIFFLINLVLTVFNNNPVQYVLLSTLNTFSEFLTNNIPNSFCYLYTHMPEVYFVNIQFWQLFSFSCTVCAIFLYCDCRVCMERTTDYYVRYFCTVRCAWTGLRTIMWDISVLSGVHGQEQPGLLCEIFLYCQVCMDSNSPDYYVRYFCTVR